MKGNRDRDALIAQAIAQLPIPEHRPDFWAKIDALVTDEVSFRRQGVGPQSVAARWTLRAVVGVVVAVVAAVAIGLLQLRTTGEASAAEVKERVAAALMKEQALTGEIVYRAVDSRTGKVETQRWRFASTARGDFRLTVLGGTGDLAYDTRTGVERAITTSASLGAGRFYAVRSGLAPGPPDPGPSDSVLERELGAVVRVLLAAHDPRVDEIDYGGAQAWRVVVPVRPNRVYPDVDRLDITVDQETGFPLRAVATLGGRFRSELRIVDLKAPATLSRAAFSIRFPKHAAILRTDGGFRRTSLDDVRSAVGYSPPVPARVPMGYQLAEVAVARRAPSTGAGGANPPSRNVAALAYRRGFDKFVVTSRARGPRDEGWRDPFGIEGINLRSTVVTLTRGALAGTRAQLVLDPRVVPHLWLVTPDLVMTVAGDLNRSQLVEVVESLPAP